VKVLSVAHKDIWEDNDLLFPNPTGAAWQTDTRRKHLLALCASAKVPVLTPHGIRHTYASHVAELVSVAVVRDLLGHSNVAITNRYLHVSDQGKRDGSDALARLFGAS
jgi:integrase